MKNIPIKLKRLSVFAGAALFLFALQNVIGYVFDCPCLGVAAAIERESGCQTQNRLLKEATDRIGACTPESAAGTWAGGLKERSAALQYAVMTRTLKDIYAKELEKNAPNWVTGISSPWVEDYKIVKTEKPDGNTAVVELKFSTATSTGPAGDYKAVLTLVCQEGFWRIAKIAMDEGLYPYTGFTP